LPDLEVYGTAQAVFFMRRVKPRPSRPRPSSVRVEPDSGTAPVEDEDEVSGPDEDEDEVSGPEDELDEDSVVS
jgi:hypothetical protein